LDEDDIVVSSPEEVDKKEVLVHKGRKGHKTRGGVRLQTEKAKPTTTAYTTASATMPFSPPFTRNKTITTHKAVVESHGTTNKGKGYSHEQEVLVPMKRKHDETPKQPESEETTHDSTRKTAAPTTTTTTTAPTISLVITQDDESISIQHQVVEVKTSEITSPEGDTADGVVEKQASSNDEGTGDRVVVDSEGGLSLDITCSPYEEDENGQKEVAQIVYQGSGYGMRA
jgi:hypothetical protein